MNISIFHFLNNLTVNNSFFSNLAIFIATTFGILVLIFTFIFFVYKKDVRALFLVFGTTATAWIVTKILKTIFHMPRPFINLTDMHAFIMSGGYDSFPSNHATVFTALAVATFFFYKRFGFLLMFFALLIGLSRVVVGVHFPTDILAGFLVGFGVAYFVHRWRNLILAKMPKNL